MLVLKKIKHGISIMDCWYAEQPLKDNGIVRYYQAIRPIGKKTVEFRTFLSDLSVSEEEIVSVFSKSCKYKVNRAPREGVTVVCKNSGEIAREDMEQFADFYIEFYKSKGYGPVNKDKLLAELEMYREQGALSIGVASVGKIKVVYHTHILDQKYARLFHSASLYRVEETIPTTVVGMANRYLHKEEMLYFKKQGISVYDWGGAGTSEEVRAITEFKESFGGTPMVFYHGEEKKGIAAKVYGFAVSLIGMITK